MTPMMRPARRGVTCGTRAVLRDALASTVGHAPNLSSAALWFGVDPATLRRWLAGETRIDMEAVLRSKRLGPRMTEELARRVPAMEVH